ncbi:oxidase [Lichenicola cladoniae]|uniref:Oxidase n=1 Tax=Lichenicola cladoniae TaxID=1484109 RepID=A0A6M8HUZ8_9PROT|nr:oxidase [Lichenicola cladoniae]NPD69493.1 oxidase [Acetobacteraceae bacterium]QKE92140.1 oxidase [Lichenicola cladoniae]
MALVALTEADRRLLWSKMRTPAIVLVVLLLMLGTIVLLGAWLPFRQAWIIEAVLTLLMVGTVLIVSMELGAEPPIIRFFAVVGFFWVAILFGMTLLDYFTR